MPQLAQTSPTLRHAAMAVGAMSLSINIDEGSITRHEDAKYLHAISYYSRSLRLQAQRASFRTAVFLSLILLLFESLRGQISTALHHVNHGMALLVSSLTNDGSDDVISQFSPDPRPVLKDAGEVFSRLALQAQTVLSGRVGGPISLRNVAQGLAEKSLAMESFISKLRQACPAKADINRIPKRFNDLDEFEQYWTAISLEQTAIRPRIMEITHTSGILDLDNHNDLGHAFSELLGNGKVRHFFAECQTKRGAINAALIPVFDKMMLMEPKSPVRLRALQLRLQYLAHCIFDNPPQYLDIKAMQALSPACQNYLALAAAALDAVRHQLAAPTHLVSVECDIAWHLLLISLYCRDERIREKAVQALRQYPGHDGLWNTRALYVLAQKNQVVEAINALEGSPPEQWRRLWRREYVFEDGGERVLFRFLEMDREGRWTLIEEVARLEKDLDNVKWKRQHLGSGKLLLPQLTPR